MSRNKFIEDQAEIWVMGDESEIMDTYSAHGDSFRAGFRCADKNPPEEFLSVIKSVESALAYMMMFDCEQSCDPSVGFHQPECCIARDFYEVLRAYYSRKSK